MGWTKTGGLGVVAVVCALTLGAAPARAQDVNYVSFATGLSQVTDIAHAGDDRLFVTQQSGLIRVIQNDGTVNSAPFLDLTGIVSSGFERGLLGLAFHPNYASNGYFYVNYTNSGGNTVVARYTVSADPDVADAASGVQILFQNQTFGNHNGGDLSFGPADGYLYIGLGDGGSGCDPNNDAQDPTTLLGKMLRIDVDGAFPYAIPPTNPFLGVPGVLDEIWASGLRNPWRFSFDRMAPHDMWIGDVGQVQREEIDRQPGGSAGGENYGWDCREGFIDASASGCTTTATCPPPGEVLPVHDYDRSGGRCSVTGGFVYRGVLNPGFTGEYFFADWCSRDMYSLRSDGGGGYILTTYVDKVPTNPRTFGEDASGEVYVATSNTVYRLEDPSPPVTGCPASPSPSCDAPASAVLQIRDSQPPGPSSKDRITWKFTRGPAETQDGFASPDVDTEYVWCAYAGTTPTLIAEIGVAGGGTCGNKPCWKELGSRGYKFADSSASQDGAIAVLLRGDPIAPRTRLKWKARGSSLPVPSLPLSQAGNVSVRVHNSANGNCWGADFPPSTATRNDSTTFKAKFN